jgi:hypothetical protein
MLVHLPNENYITYTAKKDMSGILSQDFLRRTMLTEWFVANKTIQMAEILHIVIFLQSGDGMTKQGHGREEKRVLAK